MAFKVNNGLKPIHISVTEQRALGGLFFLLCLYFPAEKVQEKKERDVGRKKGRERERRERARNKEKEERSHSRFKARQFRN